MDTPNTTSLEQEVADFLQQHAGGERLIILAAAAVVLTGTGYLVFEATSLHNAHDVAFVILLCAASCFLAIAVLYFRTLLCQSAVVLYQDHGNAGKVALQVDLREGRRPTWKYRVRSWRVGVGGPGQLLALVFDRRGMIACGLTYGILLGSAPIVVGIDRNNWASRWLLISFLFTANLLAGAALYSLAMTLRQCWHLATRLDITYFVRTTTAVQTYTRLLVAMSIIGAVYIGTCQMSAVFSEFGGVWVCVYAIFSIGIYLCMFYVPQMPIRRRLRQERDALLTQVSAKKAQILNGGLTHETLDVLARIYDTEDRIIKMGLGLPGTSDIVVGLLAVASGVVPFLTTLLQLFAIRQSH